MLRVSFEALHPWTMVFCLPGGVVAYEPHGLLRAMVWVLELVLEEHVLQSFCTDGSVIISVKQYLQGNISAVGNPLTSPAHAALQSLYDLAPRRQLQWTHDTPPPPQVD